VENLVSHSDSLCEISHTANRLCVRDGRSLSAQYRTLAGEVSSAVMVFMSAQLRPPVLFQQARDQLSRIATK